MAQTKREIQELLEGAGTQPRYRFGQNFMIDQNLVRLIAEAGQLVPGDLVVEVGPGTGTLTEELLATGAQVLAVEIDRDLAGLLRERLGDRENFRLIEGDALAGKHAIHPEVIAALQSGLGRGQGVKLVANLPYNVASPLIIELLRAGTQLLAFTVQKEVADRLRAGAEDEAYGPLSVMARLLADVEVLRVLPPQAFWPAPQIESALVRMMRRDRLGEHSGAFGTFVHKVFSSRRKTLRKGLSQMGIEAEGILTPLGIDPQLRPENLSPEQHWAVYRLAAESGAWRSGAGEAST